MKRLTAAALLLAALAGGARATALSKDTLRFGTESTYPPYEFRGEDGSLRGYEIELAEAVAAKLGKKIEWVDMAFDGLLPSLLTGGLDVVAAGLSATPERTAKFAFSLPIGKKSYCAFLTRAGGGIADESGLKGKTVALQLGSYYEKYVRSIEGVTVRLYQKNDDCVREVALGRADAVALDSAVSKTLLDAKDFKGRIVIAFERQVNKYLRAMAMSKDDPELLAAVNGAMRQMAESGETEALYAKWFY